MMAKAKPTYELMPIQDYLAKQIELAASMGKSQREIANELGYERPTMISMFKRGEAKVPLDKVPALARSLNVDPAFLFRLALHQYWDKAVDAIDEIFGEVLTKPEREVAQMFRRVTKGDESVVPDAALEKKMREWVREKSAK